MADSKPVGSFTLLKAELKRICDGIKKELARKGAASTQPGKGRSGDRDWTRGKILCHLQALGTWWGVEGYRAQPYALGTQGAGGSAAGHAGQVHRLADALAASTQNGVALSGSSSPHSGDEGIGAVRTGEAIHSPRKNQPVKQSLSPNYIRGM
jgi:hypothetical protein